MKASSSLLLAYYGDDFTGSTDALEFLSRAGIKTVLFIEPPDSDQLDRYKDLDAIGVAGRSRSMLPSEMETELRPAFSALRDSGVRHVHYKVCSTFDSSPIIGSIGRAIDIGAEVFSNPFIPLLVAAPALGRHCVFGNLFARMGTGSKGKVYRLDRHPSMSCHPVTPAHESDLRLHLSHQTQKKVGLIDILQIGLPVSEVKKALEDVLADGSEIILFDALYENQLSSIGGILDDHASTDHPLFSVGSSGIEMALGNFWTEKGRLQAPQQWSDPGEARSLLVASGSCSPVTAGQIAWAVSQGFLEVAIDTVAFARDENPLTIIEEYISEVVTAIKAGKNMILHTNFGAEDERMAETNEVFARQGMDRGIIRARTAELYGTALGRIIKAVAERAPLERVVIAGGDTSSFAARAMGIEAVEMIAPLAPGAPLCRAYAPGSSIDGLEVNFKGGQVGNEDYFGMLLHGRYIP